MKQVLAMTYAIAIGINIFIIASGVLVSNWELVSLGVASGALCGFGLHRSLNDDE